MTVAKETNAFAAFEKHNWELSAQPYHQMLGALTCQAADILWDAVNQNQGVNSLLDLATGPGYFARYAAEQGCKKVLGIDFSENMIALARTLSPNFGNLNFKLGDAEQLQEEDAAFDAVTMNFGLLHLARPHQALYEAYRVLKPGGKFAFSVWSKPERAVGLGIVLAAITTFSDSALAIPDGPPFFYFSDESNSLNGLKNAGFIQVSFQEISLPWVVASGEDIFTAFLKGTARTGGLLRLQSQATLDLIRNKIYADSESYRKGDLLHIPMGIVLAVGTK
ncbi:MAG TPA: class I SAM-dependent methyltransferase [Gammaproteobacteria bacterium]|nr:class I SAM-dependent methyltransferase [Gammaproteobacteria bacterium]